MEKKNNEVFPGIKAELYKLEFQRPRSKRMQRPPKLKELRDDTSFTPTARDMRAIIRQLSR